MNPAPSADPDPTPDPNPFFRDFKDAKFYKFFFLELSRRHIIFSLKILFFAKIWC
jgi:hypothetical protein